MSNFRTPTSTKVVQRKRKGATPQHQTTKRKLDLARHLINNRDKKLKRQTQRIWSMQKGISRAREKINKKQLSEQKKTKSTSSGKENVEHVPSPVKRAHTFLREEGVSPTKSPKLAKRVVLSEILLSDAKENKKKTSAFLRKKELMKCGLSRFATNILKTYRRKPTRQRNKNTFSTWKAKQEKIQKFLKRMDNATCLPGRKDSLKVGHEKKQVYILRDYMLTLWKKYKAEDPGNNKESLSFFCKARPRNVRLVRFASRITCLCSKHQDFSLKLRALKSGFPNNSEKPSSENGKIFLQKCPSKADAGKMLLDMNIPRMTNISYDEWRREEEIDETGSKSTKTKLTKNIMSFQRFRSIFLNEYEVFSDHSSRVQAQYQAALKLKQNMTATTCTIQMDFAKNFCCGEGEEIQSAYWAKVSVTLHPLVVHFVKDGKVEHLSFVMVVDTHLHGPPTVWAIMKNFVPYLLARLPFIKNIHYLTHSPTSQYRNRQMFQALARHKDEFGVTGHWLYFEAGHGKGPCDGVGGVAKRRAYDAIKRGTSVISDAKSFFQWGRSEMNISAVKYLFTSAEDVVLAKQEVDSWTPLKIQGIMKTHAVISTPGAIYTRDTSCYDECCYNFKRIHLRRDVLDGMSMLLSEMVDVNQ